MKKKIALIYGGEGEERAVSRKSAEALCRLIDRETYEILPVYISESGNWYMEPEGREVCATFPVRLGGSSGFLHRGRILPVYAALPVLHGDFGEDGRVQGALDCAHIPYVGCGVLAGAAAADKITAKIIAEGLKIPTARWLYSSGGAEEALTAAEEQLGYPMFIKPSGLGSSVGAARVLCREDFLSAFETASLAGDGRVLIEELVSADYELECGIFGTGGRLTASASGRIDTDGAFYDYSAKYESKSGPIASHGGGIPLSVKERAEAYALRLCRFMGVRQISRVDFFLRGEELLFNEINSFPGMTSRSLYPLLCEDMGIKKENFINLLIEDAVRK